jgi:malonate-semialdehyde dehydrogenase (acetylating)/methylmalonate-semialdehyde dehydrogenase
MPDALIDQTVSALMNSIYGNTGQRCLAGANVIIVGEDKAFYKKFRDAFVERASKIKVGYGLDESVQMGPVRDKEKKERIISYIEKGIKEGAKLILDGRKANIIGDYPDTCFLGPTLFEEVNPDMTIAREEIFGPVATFMRAETLDKAIDIIHNIPFGNAASIFTQSGKWAREFQYNTGCGNIGINIGIAAPTAFFPFSGMKDSFRGVLHPQGQETIRFFTESKVVIQRWL